MKTALRIALLLKLVLLPGLLSAHPMGNFSINHHSTIHVSSGVISVTTVLDFAEIATFQMFPDPRNFKTRDPKFFRHPRDCPRSGSIRK
jgi:nickel/cobalt exporter